MPHNTLIVNEKSFAEIKLLGKGKGGYSYLVTDGANEYVLKQIHHEPCDYYKFGNKLEAELNDYRKLKEVGVRIPEMIDFDEKNERILKKYICGSTIYDLVLIDGVKESYFEQIRHMLKLLYPANLNIDYFPTNFVVQNEILYYIDYECNSYSDEWNFENWGIKYWAKTKDFMAQIKKGKISGKERSNDEQKES